MSTIRPTRPIHVTYAHRSGLRFLSGERGVFMPTPVVIDDLELLGLVERSPDGLDVGMPDRYRLTGQGCGYLERALKKAVA